MAKTKEQEEDKPGYGRPPVASRFRKGVSGNPLGRPKKSRNVATMLMEAFNRPVPVRWNGRSRKISAIEAILRILKGKALRGNARAAGLVNLCLDLAGLTAEVSEEERQRRGFRLPRALEAEEMDLIQGEALERDRQRYLAMAESREAPEDGSPVVPPAIKTGDRLAAQRKFAEALDAYRSELTLRKTQLTTNSADETAQYNFRRAVARIGLVAYAYFQERMFEQVIAITDEAIEEAGSQFWVTPNNWTLKFGTRWLSLLRTHARMFCNREDQAREFYEGLQTQKQYRNFTSWECVVQQDFFQLRLTGHSHPLMSEIEKRFCAAGWIRDTRDPIPPRVDDGLPHAADIIRGDGLLQQGKLDEALAAYHRLFSACENDVAIDRQARAELTLVADRIGRLTRPFLLAGNSTMALSCADDAIRYDPYSTSLNLNRAHALMFLNRMDGARRIYFDYYGKRMPLGRMGQDAIKEDFKQLREAGHSHSLMTEMEKRFAAALWDRNLGEPAQESDHAEPPPRTVTPKTPSLPPPERDDLQSAETLHKQGRFEDAFEVCKRRIVKCDEIRRKPVPNLQANEDRHAAVTLITELALSFVAAGQYDKALATADYALSVVSSSPIASLRRAHALMFLGKTADARGLYLQSHKVKVAPGKTGKDIILQDFDLLRAHDRFDALMDEMEKLLGKAKTTCD